MDEIKHFFESSSIHGLYYISATKKILRYFWMTVVFCCFVGAMVLIHESFKNWEKSPISTTIETLPISQITFPNVTICPPKDLFLNLNYDIMQAENVNLNNNSRAELLEYATSLLENGTFQEILKNLSILEDPDRYYNWYHGYTEIKFPFYDVTANQMRKLFNIKE